MSENNASACTYVLQFWYNSLLFAAKERPQMIKMALYMFGGECEHTMVNFPLFIWSGNPTLWIQLLSKLEQLQSGLK